MSNHTTPAKQARDHYAAMRAINRNIRLGRYEGRNNVSTQTTLFFHQDRARVALRALPRELQGLIWDEHHLADRIACAKIDGQERPELKARLRDLRKMIRKVS